MSLPAYTEQIEVQRIANELLDADTLRRTFEGLVVPENYLGKLLPPRCDGAGADQGPTCPDHRVWTATLVDPRTVPFASLNATKMRLVCGTNGTLPLAVAKMAKVGFALAPIVVVTVEPIDEMHCPLIGLVWQRLMASGKVAAPVFAVAVIEALAPTLTVATAKAFEPLVPVMCRMPSFCAVAASATMSGTGVAEAE